MIQEDKAKTKKPVRHKKKKQLLGGAILAASMYAGRKIPGKLAHNARYYHDMRKIAKRSG